MYKSKQPREKGLTTREKRFCQWFVRTGNRKEAAVRAGFGFFADGMSVCLMERPDIKEYIRQLEAEAAAEVSVRAGYERIAYGCVNDAVRLMCTDEEKIPEILENLDLFCVSEIKKPKGGGMEIKFFDRLKALEKLGQAHVKRSDSFLQALEKSSSEENWEEESDGT